MEWDFNIVNWADVEVNSSQQQRSLRRNKQICFLLRLYQRKDFCKTSSLSTVSNTTRGWPRQPLQRCWQSKTQRYWGGTQSTPKDGQEIQGHTRGETKLQSLMAMPVPDLYCTSECRDKMQQDSKKPGPQGSQAGSRLCIKPIPDIVLPEQNRAHCGVTSDPQDVTSTLSPHSDQKAGRETSLNPIPVRVSKQNQPNRNLRSTEKKKKITIRYLSPLLQPWQM